MQTDDLLNRLDRVRKTGPGSWLACCPSHEDRSPSLSVKEADDGRILIHCFGGCSVHEVVGALGLEIGDLFPPRQHRGEPSRRPFPAMDALRCCAFEALIVATIGRHMLSGQAPDERDHDRLQLAVERIMAAVNAVAPGLRGVRS